MGVCAVFLLLASSALLFMQNSIGGADLPSSVTQYTGKTKRIDQNENISNFTYGPYKTVKNGKYLILIFYQAQAEGNSYDVACGGGNKILSDGNFNSNYRVKLLGVDVETEATESMEIRTNYGGDGDFYLKGITIMSAAELWMVILAVLLVVAASKNYLLECTERTLVQMIGLSAGIIVFSITNPFYFRISTVLLFALILYALQLKKRISYRGTAVIGITVLVYMELLNSRYYGFWKMEAAVYSILISVLIYQIIGLLPRGKSIVTELYTVLILIYQTAQATYYSFFKSFFRLNAVLLVGTAAGAENSVTELLEQYQITCYLSILICYMSACMVLHFKNRNYG